MSTLGKTILVKGELRSDEDLTVEGRIEGHVLCAEGAVLLAAGGNVTGDILAREITVSGRIAGQLVASDVVEVRADAHVSGQVVSRRFILDERAHFVGRVEPQHLEAALRVHEFQQRKRDAG
jgi:cytoskeletal protein CcmA (bactofilin family)